jgi:hypothetical protein
MLGASGHTIRRLVARVPEVQSRSAIRLRLESWLERTDLRPPGLPPSAVLLLRRVDLRLPLAQLSRHSGGDAGRPSGTALRELLAAQYRAAIRPQRGRVPSTSGAVVFADRSEYLACVVLSMARGDVRAWWWPSVPPAIGVPADPIASLLVEEPFRIPAIVGHLDEWKDVPTVFRKMSVGGAARALDAVAVAFGFDVKALRSTTGLDDAPVGTRQEAVSSDVPPSGGGRRDKGHVFDRPAERVVQFVQNAAGPLPTVEHVVLAAAARMLRRKPKVARSSSFVEELLATMQAETGRRPGASRAVSEPRHQPPDPTHRDPAGAHGSMRGAPTGAVPAEPSAENPFSAAIDRDREPGQPPRGMSAEADEASAVQGHVRRPATNAEDQTDPKTAPKTARVLDPDHDSPIEALHRTAQVDRSDVVEESETDRHSDGYVATRLGGAFYLLNVIAAMRIERHAPLWWSDPPGLWVLLEVLTRGLLADDGEDVSHDPLWRLLALLDDREAGSLPEASLLVDPLGIPSDWETHPEMTFAPARYTATLDGSHRRWLACVLPYIGSRMCRSLGRDHSPGVLDAILRIPATVYVTSSHLDVAMPLEAISLEVRVAGLDRDPGWLPSGGRVVQFHFEAPASSIR